MPTSARLFVYEDLRETMTIQKKERNSHDSPVPCAREKQAQLYSYHVIICILKKSKITSCQKIISSSFFILLFSKVFILCWAPYIVFDLLQVYGHIPKSKTMIAVATFIQSLAPLNSAANPLIYCLFSTHLCRNLR
jgi:hypothetical protein